MERWLEDVRKYAGKCLHQMMIGNKCDLAHRREVQVEDAEKFAAHYGIGDTLETSAKVGFIVFIYKHLCCFVIYFELVQL